MKIFIDSGNIKEIEGLMPLGIIDGITTNPTLLAKEPGDYRENLKTICRIVQGLDYSSPGGLAVEGWVNGEKRQGSSTKELIFPIPMLIAYISANMTLLPGDIISTGTPSGIGPLHAGDTVTIKVEGVGELTNSVR